MRPVQPPPEMYVRRIVDDEIDRLVRGGSAAIAIEGAKAVGKTATGSQRVRIAYLLEQLVTRQLLQADPSRINSGEPVLIDEWQHLPETWDVVRRVVDAGAVPGQFFLTGSASALHPGTHSGAGRIV
ncbi:MAG: AAA family ATPase, partial [Actinomycetota bacterium]